MISTDHSGHWHTFLPIIVLSFLLVISCPNQTQAAYQAGAEANIKLLRDSTWQFNSSEIISIASKDSQNRGCETEGKPIIPKT